MEPLRKESGPVRVIDTIDKIMELVFQLVIAFLFLIMVIIVGLSIFTRNCSETFPVLTDILSRMQVEELLQYLLAAITFIALPYTVKHKLNPSISYLVKKHRYAEYAGKTVHLILFYTIFSVLAYSGIKLLRFQIKNSSITAFGFSSGWITGSYLLGCFLLFMQQTMEAIRSFLQFLARKRIPGS